MTAKRRGLNNDTLGPGNHDIKVNSEKYNLAELRAKSIGRKFDIVSVHQYKNVTEREIELRDKYAASLVSNYADVSIRRIKLAQTNYTFTATDSVETYSIHIGGRGWGKVVVTITRIADTSILRFVVFKTSPSGKYSSTKRRNGTWTK